MQESVTYLTTLSAILWVMVGILFSLILPVSIRILKEEASKPLRAFRKGRIEVVGLGTKIKEAWEKYGGKKYLGIVLATAVIAVAIVILFGLKFMLVRDAALAGFAWESLINKSIKSVRS